MTGKEQREKVVKGLECIRDWSQFAVNKGWLVAGASEKMVKYAEDALELLKAQEPRVMELEEVKKLKKNDVVWLEVRANNKGAIPVIVRSRYVWPHSTVMVIDFVNSSGCTITIQEEDFCYRDRCWTSRPTEEQMEAIPWA